MKFHHVCGEAVRISDDYKSASRSDHSFSHGIVFCDAPIKLNQHVSLELKCTSLWSGALRIGVTSQNPNTLHSSDLPKYAFPDLAQKEGYWVRPVNENETFTGMKIIIYINAIGQLHLFMNNQHRGVYISNLPTNQNLWLLFDLYGTTKAITLVPSVNAFNSEVVSTTNQSQ
ncbi:hypothetical protein LOTGIDRAFT_152366 [Lottia gigantea]|uniref:NHR domain-containing protein n=1 Tax=Lottia gigantea TaxID=225164 RepID=V4BCR4_LOTGI|nr:hypothetical protein LOTGIDRAFT_152366 [Lottia gigantea]ESP05511.1 hypothetical protein LOTGIDRAFT_152366 [Lottia gigantea]